MVCDDLSLPLHNEKGLPEKSICEKATTGFSRALGATQSQPLINGVERTWKAALDEAGRLLSQANHPLIHGLIGDLVDSRAAHKLAEHFGGTIDHLHGDAIARNLQIYQQGGWQISSMGEVRNRADLVIVISDDLKTTLPRLQEKLFHNQDRLHASAPPTIYALDENRLEVLSILRARLANKPLQADTSTSDELVSLINGADYPVFMIGPMQAGDAELIIRTCVGLVRDINESKRSALLMLGMGEGDTTAQLSGAWHNGFGIRTSFTKGYPVQDLQQFSADKLLASGDVDLLVWISTLSTTPPPDTTTPTVVIGHPAMAFNDAPPTLFLPVSIPGVHRAGYLHRADGLRLVPLNALIESPLMSSAALCEQLITTESRTC
jgi:formylmethanofuran dehydrogenase subunit B